MNTLDVPRDIALTATRKLTRVINSQVNEQANVGRKVDAEPADLYKASKFFFHVSLFLAIKNRDKIEKLDISSLHV